MSHWLGDVRDVERHRSDVGAAVTLLEREGTTAAVSVTYACGQRDEPAGLDGAAHLAEHLRFRGDGTRDDYFGAVQRLGGRANAYTAPDYTQLYATCPSDSVHDLVSLELARAAFVGWDRTWVEEELRVITAEVRTKLDGSVRGGFSWNLLPSVLFTARENQHSGFTDNQALGSGDHEEDVRRFYTGHYAPTHAGLVVVAPRSALVRVRESLAGAPVDDHPPPVADRVSEPVAAGLSTTMHHARSPSRATAVGFVGPDPREDLGRWAAVQVLLEMVTREARRTSEAWGRDALRFEPSIGVVGHPLEAVGATTVAFEIFHGEDRYQVGDLVSHLRSVARGEVAPTAVGTARDRVLLRTLSLASSAENLARTAGWTEFVQTEPDLLWRWPAAVEGVDVPAVVAAALGLTDQTPSVLRLLNEVP